MIYLYIHICPWWTCVFQTFYNIPNLLWYQINIISSILENIDAFRFYDELLFTFLLIWLLKLNKCVLIYDRNENGRQYGILVSKIQLIHCAKEKNISDILKFISYWHPFHMLSHMILLILLLKFPHINFFIPFHSKKKKNMDSFFM